MSVSSAWKLKLLAAVLMLAGMEALGQTRKNVTTLGTWLRPGTLSASAGIWGHTGANGKEYALLTSRRPGGLSIVDISDPEIPKEVNFIASTGNSVWFEVTTYRNTAYQVSQQNNDGLRIIDLAPLDQGRPAVLVKSSITWFRTAHTVFVDTTVAPARLFVAYGPTAGVMIFGLQDPQNPVLLHTIPGESHDMFARGDRVYVSNQAKSTVTIWNIANVTSPVKIGIIDFNQVSPSLGEPAKSIAHNAWPSEDNRYLFTTEETKGNTVKAFDITDFSLTKAPKLIGTYIGVKSVIAHNVYIKGSLMYVAHYTAGVRVVDVSDPANMKEVAFNRPSASTELFGGSWGVYPWFKSGVFIHGDDVKGLFVEKLESASSARERSEMARFALTALDGDRLHLRLARPGPYRISIHALSGRELFNHPGHGEAGVLTLSLRGRLSRGSYVARLIQGDQVISAPFSLR